MNQRRRAIAIARRRPQPPSLLAWLALAAVLLAAAAVQAQVIPVQANGGATDGRTAPPAISQPNTDTRPGSAAGMQPRGGDGVITPPPSVDPGMPIARPNTDAFPTPTLRPPGTPGGDPKVVPK